MGEVCGLHADALHGGADVGSLHGGERRVGTDLLLCVLRDDLQPGEAPGGDPPLLHLCEQNARELLQGIAPLAILSAAIRRFLELGGREPDLPTAVARTVFGASEA